MSRINASLKVQPVHSNEKDVQAEYEAKGRPSLLSYPQWTRPEKRITKRNENAETHETKNKKKVNYCE